MYLADTVDFVHVVNQYKWFLVQLKKNLRKFVVKIVLFSDIIWYYSLSLPISQNKQRQMVDRVLVRQNGTDFVGYILLKSENKCDVLKEQQRILSYYTTSVYSLHECHNIMRRLHDCPSFWLMVMYSPNFTMSWEDEYVFKIVHKNEVALKVDNSKKTFKAFIQDKGFTYKGIVTETAKTLEELSTVILPKTF